jgi:hypothetical protein
LILVAKSKSPSYALLGKAEARMYQDKARLARLSHHAKTVQNVGSHPFSLTYEPLFEVLGAHGIMSE